MRQPTRSWKIYVYGGAFVLLLYVIKLLSRGGLFAAFQLEKSLEPSINSPFFGLLLLIPLAIIVIGGMVALSERFALMSREVASLSPMFFLSALVAQQYEIEFSIFISSTLLLISLLLHLATYERNEAPHNYVQLGLLFFLLCVLDIRMILYLPLWGITAFQMKSLSPKGSIAFGVGLFNPILLLGIYWISMYNYNNTIICFQSWLSDLLTPTFVLAEVSQYLSIVLLMILGVVAIFSSFWGLYHENIRQRAQYSVFFSWLVYGLLIINVYPSPQTLLVPLFAMSVLAARAISMLDKKIYRLSLLFLVSICLTMSIFI